ncbi:polysaccharide pyruvyl transferase family protein [Oceanihabitans sediminis]|uniref:polysaccharide pyruvyl transferase family protein n=1 Tax=Oceanihabitans sediminis TaxID=1812012 RepID=UPI00299E8711|nr:polysaccharide pyruvyl transferase family protein [Oceanihabitans sediminis]MDX1774861.1 polysaccharide pyruvyl transferase family protein [Oceanihabitans sediminis]
MEAKKQKINNIFLTGFFGAGNVGDEAVALAVYNGVKLRFPLSSTTMVTRNKEYTKSFAGIKDSEFCIGFFPSLDYFKHIICHLKNINKSDLIIIGGGGLLQDVHSWTTIASQLLPACIGLVLNKKIATVGIGVGPIERKWLKNFVQFVLNNISLIQVRDLYSQNELIQYGVKPENINITADVVPSLDLKTIYELEKKTDQNQSKPNMVGIAFRKWEGVDKKGLASLCQKLIKENIKIIFLCYEPKSDQLFYKSIIDQVKGINEKIEIHIPINLEDAIKTLNQCNFILSMRLHGCVFATALEKDHFSFPYDNKVTEFETRVGNHDQILSIFDISPEIADSIFSRLDNKKDISETTKQFYKEKSLSKSNFNSLENIAELKSDLKVKFIAVGWLNYLILRSLIMYLNKVFKYLYRKTK